MRKLPFALTLVILAFTQTAHAASCSSGDPRVLQAIPAIAQVFAPLAGVNWQNFAQDLAGICAVESGCNPSTKHVLQNGAWSQYQGLYQMNMNEVARAENYLNQSYPQLQQLTQSGQIPQNAWTFFEQATQSGRSSAGDRRFLPEYGVILGAAKHIQIQKQLQKQYPGDPLRQAAGDMVAQFSGIAESQIAAGNFTAPITGTPDNANTEAGALAVNKVSGATLAGAIESAGATYGTCMSAMMTQMSQVTGGLTSVPTTVAPFTAPAYMPGTSPVLNIPYSGVSTLMEMGVIPPTTAAAITPTMSNLPPLNPSAPIFSQPVIQNQTSSTSSSTFSASTNTSACTPQYSCVSGTRSYQSSSCSIQTVQTCQYGCSGNACAQAPAAASSTSNGNSILSIFTNLTSATTSASSSVSLNADMYTVVQGDRSQQNGQVATPTPERIAESIINGQDTFEQSTYANFSGTSGPLAGLFAQLQTALVGLLAYLRSL